MTIDWVVDDAVYCNLLPAERRLHRFMSCAKHYPLHLPFLMTIHHIFLFTRSPEKEAKAAREERVERPQPSRRLLNLVHLRLVCR